MWQVAHLLYNLSRINGEQQLLIFETPNVVAPWHCFNTHLYGPDQGSNRVKLRHGRVEKATNCK